MYLFVGSLRRCLVSVMDRFPPFRVHGMTYRDNIVDRLLKSIVNHDVDRLAPRVQDRLNGSSLICYLSWGGLGVVVHSFYGHKTP